MPMLMSQTAEAKVFAKTDHTLCVCVPKEWTIPLVEEFANQMHTRPFPYKWFVDQDIAFYDGRSNPCECNELPEARRHWLLLT